MKKQLLKNGLISIGILLLLLCWGLFRINTDKGIELRILYKYFDEVNSTCSMHVETKDGDYTLYPYLPVDDTKSGGWLDAVYELPDSYIDISSLSIDLLSQEKGISSLTSFEIYNHSMPVAKYKAEDIPKLFTSNADRTILDSIGINYHSDNKDIALTSSDLLITEIERCRHSDTGAYANCIVISLFISVAIFCILTYIDWSSIRAELKQLKTWDCVLLIIVITMFILSCIMAFYSKNHAHADEEVTRHAIDYYLRAWNAPAWESNWIAGTSSYRGGNTYRATESTLYYLFAGKVAWLSREYLNIRMYYRTAGIVLLFLMMLITWIKRQERNILFISILLSPQICYLFSYATSDHWDYFWAWVILLIVCDKSSVLHKLVENKTDIKFSVYILVCAFAFSQMFVGKSNYLIILTIPFIELLDELFKSKNRLRLFVVYIVILCITLVMAYGIKNRYRDPGESISVAVTGSTAIEQDDTPFVMNSMWSAPRDQGISFNDYMWHMSYMPTPAILYTSALGTYFWNSVNPKMIYYYIITILYMSLGVMFIAEIVKLKDKEVLWKSIGSIMACIALVCVAIWYCYTRTYQPQGRYILPVFVILVYMFHQTKQLSVSKKYMVNLTAIFLLSIINYLFVGIICGYHAGFMIW